jgi:NAD(P)H-hydrate epimerase
VIEIHPAMKLVTAKQMQSLDRAAIDGHGIPSLTLMERAGTGVANAAHEIAAKKRGAAVVVCGRGNNGGDGLVAARLLIERGLDVFVFLMARPADLSADAKANWERLVPLTTHLHEILSFDDLMPHHPTIAGASVIVDALFGTGLMREITAPVRQIIEYLNSVKRPIVAVDIPSGLSADKGAPLGISIKANVTVTFGLPKLGLYIGEGSEYAGRVSVCDIGIPSEEVEKLGTKYHLTDESMVKSLFAPRVNESHKGSFGHVGVIAGSGGKLGAGYLASMAALRSGSGLVTYFLPETAFEKFDARYPEIMCEPIPDKGRAHFHPDGAKALVSKADKISVIAMGPAMGTHDETREFEHALIGSLDKPMVIDADGLNNLDLGQIKRRRNPIVLTPHPKEFSRMIGSSTDKVQKDRFNLAIEFASQNNVCLVLKGYHTVIATPDGRAFVNPTGGPAMASAGMGDALTGLIAGLIAQGISADMSAVAGTFLHGFAGDIAKDEIGDRGVVASDVIKRIPKALKKVMREEDAQIDIA